MLCMSRKPWRVTSTALDLVRRAVREVDVDDHVVRPAGLQQPLDDARREGLRRLEVGDHRRRGRPPASATARSPGTPSAMPSIAPATVPDMVTSSAALWPRLTPESTRSGLASFISSSIASITQSVGVPVTAKRRSSSCRTRSGSDRVSAREAPDCSASGAQTQTSSDSRARDPLQRRQALGVDAVVVGEQDPHRLARRCGSGRACRGAGPAGWRCGRARPGSSPSAPPACGRRPGPSRSACGRSACPSRRPSWQRASMRRAWKSPQLEQELISR